MIRTCLSVAALVVLAAPGSAQPPPPAAAAVTHVMAALLVTPGADRARLNGVLPEEVKATVRLYLDGKIQQWYGRADNRGVVFILNCASVDEAKALMEQLPLARAGLATFEYTALTPLTPLRLLVGDGPPARGAAQR